MKTCRVGPLGVNSIAYSSDGARCALIDPGDEPERLLELVEGLELASIVLTHGHLDHWSALPSLLTLLSARNEPPPTVAIHEADADYLGRLARVKNEAVFRAIRGMGFFAKRFAEPPRADRFISDGSEIPGATSLIALHSPGHSPGHCCFYDAGAGILLAGDAIFQGARGRVDCPDSDEAALLRSVERILSSLPPETVIIPGHGPFTTVGAEAARLFGRSP